MKKFFLILAAIFFFGGSNCAAENLKFIDAIEDSGYYYDADSVKNFGNDRFTVRMAIIKADTNQMFAYDVLINHVQRTYRILGTQTLSYDTRAVLEVDNSERPTRKFDDRSEMGQMVTMILYGS